MNKRPKSREETPKEGSDSARSATAPQQYATALHKVQEFLDDFRCIIDAPQAQAQEDSLRPFIIVFSMN